MLNPKPFRLRVAATLLGIALMAPIGKADEYLPVETMPASPVEPGGKPVDILGLTPGLKCSDALNLVRKTYREEVIEQKTQSIQTRYKGLDISTVAFLTQISVNSSDENNVRDNLDVHCSGIASGNQVVSIVRTLTFGGDILKAPSVVDVTKSLVTKYGPQSDGNIDAFGAVLYWVYRNGSLVPCKADSYGGNCKTTTSLEYSPREFSYFLRDLRSPGSIFIEGRIEPAYADKSKANALKIFVIDISLRNQAAKVDYDSLMTEAARRYSLESESGAIPEL